MIYLSILCSVTPLGVALLTRIRNRFLNWINEDYNNLEEIEN